MVSVGLFESRSAEQECFWDAGVCPNVGCICGPGEPGRGSLSGNSDGCSQASDGGEALGSGGDGC